MWQRASRTLFRRYREGDVAIEAYAEDYACLVWGLLELVQADGDPAWLEWALELQRRQDELFWDDGAGGWLEMGRFITSYHRENHWVVDGTHALAWLQAGRVLTLPMAVLLAAGLILIEFLLRLRERSQERLQPLHVQRYMAHMLYWPFCGLVAPQASHGG